MYRYLFFAVALLFLLAGGAIAAGKIVAVHANNAVDQMVIERIEKLGFEVEPHLDTAKHPVNLDDAVGVFIIESTSSANITNAYKDSTVPVINAETWTYDDMGFAPDGTFFSDLDDTLIIENPNHPITEGFDGEVKIHDGLHEVMTCSDLRGDLQILATAKGNGNVAISVYEEGAKRMAGSTLTRHVNIFPHTNGTAFLTEDAWTLIERAVLFGVGELSLAVDPQNALAVTWGGVKSERGRSLR